MIAEAERAMRQLNEAWAVLGDRSKRAAYDANRGSARGAGAAPPRPGPPGGTRIDRARRRLTQHRGLRRGRALVVLALVGVLLVAASRHWIGGRQDNRTLGTSSGRVHSASASTESDRTSVPASSPMSSVNRPGLITFAGFANDRAQVGMWAINPDGTGLKRLSPRIEGCQQSGRGAVRSDYTAFAFDPGTACGLLTARFDGTERVTLDVSGDCLTGCDWSEDGAWILYTRSLGAGQSEVVRAHADGSGRQVLGRGDHPRWSRDGRFVVYRTQAASLELVDVGTAAHRSLAAPYELWDPSFTPEGDKILLVGNFASSHAGLKFMDVATGAITPFCPKAGAVSEPALSPDGTSVVYNQGGPSLGVCDIATGAVRSLPPFGYAAETPEWT